MSHFDRPIRIGVIAAAGKGSRAYPKTTLIPKPLFSIEGTTLLEKNLQILFEDMGLHKVYVIVGHLQDQVLDEISKIQKKFPKYVLQAVQWTKQGLAADVASLQKHIAEPFVLILGDEFYFQTHHVQVIKKWSETTDALALIAVVHSNFLSQIRKNYSVELENDRVIDLIEKPTEFKNKILGLGTYVLTPSYFEYFNHQNLNPMSKVKELTDVLASMAKASKKVFAVDVGGEYFNINSVQDLHQATYHIRNKLFSRYKFSLLVSCCDQINAQQDVITDFRPFVNQVIPLGQMPHKKDFNVTKFSEGRMIHEGLKQCSGDAIVFVSGDGSFRSKDLPKLLEYLKDSDMVIGTRTTRQMIEQGSNMRAIDRVICVFLGKLVELVWWGQEPRFTDIECKYFVIWKDVFDKISPHLNVTSDAYIAELMIEVVRSHLRCTEIPVSYFKPVSVLTRTGLVQDLKRMFTVLSLVITKKTKSLSFWRVSK